MTRLTAAQALVLFSIIRHRKIATNIIYETPENWFPNIRMQKKKNEAYTVVHDDARDGRSSVHKETMIDAQSKRQARLRL